MSLTTQVVAELCRQHLGLPDGSKAAQFINLIPEALKLTARKIAADANLRQLLITDPAATSIAIAAGGKVNLQTGYQSFAFLLEFIDLGQIYHSGSTFPLQKRTAQEIQETAEKAGMILMWQDGFIKSLEGTTTLDEVLRVSKE